MSATRDFDVVFLDGHREPLEVTTATLPMMKAAQAAYEKYNRVVISIPGLANEWHIVTLDRTSFKTFDAARVRPFLTALEAGGFDRFYLYLDSHKDQELTALALSTGIEWARGRPTNHGRAIVARPGDEREWSSDHQDPGRHVLAVAEELASKADNRRKLAGRTGGHSHRFVWVDEDNYLPWKDLFTGVLPLRAPKVPSEITTVWIATRLPDGIACWLFNVGAGCTL